MPTKVTIIKKSPRTPALGTTVPFSELTEGEWFRVAHNNILGVKIGSKGFYPQRLPTNGSLFGNGMQSMEVYRVKRIIIQEACRE